MCVTGVTLPALLLLLTFTLLAVVRSTEVGEAAETGEFVEYRPSPGCYHFSSLVTDDTVYCFSENEPLSRIQDTDLPGDVIYLCIDGNNLGLLDKSHFSGHLSRLEKLVLKNNTITGLSQLTFAELRVLRSLDLSANPLGNLTVSNTFLGLVKLEYLFIQNADIGWIGRKVFAGLIMLKHLDLSGNKLSVLDGSMFVQEPASIENLALNDNMINTISEDTFADTRNIKVLYLHNNMDLSVLPNKLLWPLKSLENITLSYTNVSDIPGDLFKESSGLMYVDMEHTRVAGDISAAFRWVSDTMSVLYVGGTEVTFWPRVSSLTHLDLTDTNITDMEDIKLYPQMRHVTLGRMKLYCDCSISEWIADKSPSLTINYDNSTCSSPPSVRGSLVRVEMSKCLMDWWSLSTTDIIFIVVGVCTFIILLLIIGLTWGRSCYDKHVRNKLNRAAKTIVNGHTGVYVVEPDDWNRASRYHHGHDHEHGVHFQDDVREDGLDDEDGEEEMGNGVLPLNRQRSWLHGIHYRAIMTRLQRRYSYGNNQGGATAASADRERRTGRQRPQQHPPPAPAAVHQYSNGGYTSSPSIGMSPAHTRDVITHF